jgi:hypothetical protein
MAFISLVELSKSSKGKDPTMKNLQFIAVSFLLSSMGFAHQNPKAHTHGEGNLSLVNEGNKVVVEWEMPLADLVGFEHMAKSPEDKAALKKAEDTLNNQTLLTFNPEAGCELKGKKVNLFEGCHCNDKPEEKKPADKNNTTATTTSTATTAATKHDHDHDHGHDHSKESKEPEHSDAKFSYQYTCKDPSKLTQAQLQFFNLFPRSSKINAVFALGAKQGKQTLDKKDSTLRLNLK